MSSETLRTRRTTAGPAGATLLLVALAACGPAVGSLDSGSRATGADEAGESARDRMAELTALYERRDYFALRARLESEPRSGSPVEALLRAAVDAAFNEPARSNEGLAALEAGGAALPDSLAPLLHRVRYGNHARLHRYGRALEAARELLALPAADSGLRGDVRNTMRIFEALRDVPPQRVVRRGDSEIRRRPNGRVPVQVGDSSRAYVLDTGANLSLMTRSEAAALGLTIRPAGVEVGTVTEIRITADVAVAERVRLGRVELSDVIFLVVPDALLTFDEGRFTIPGLIGFPVIEALGEVAFRGGEVVRIPAEPPERPLRNLALDGLTPLIRVGVFGDTVICRLDTGAGRTSFYAPFYERHRDRIEAVGRDTVLTTTGVGGSQRVPAFLVSDVELALGESAVTLGEVEVVTDPAVQPGWEATPCNLGIDALRTAAEYVINFRSMTFLLR